MPEIYFDYANVIIFFLVGAMFVLGTLLVGALIRPKKPSETKGIPYECGEDPVGDAWIRFDIRYYTVALIYIVFAVEIAFLFPWAVVMRDALAPGSIGSFALWEGLIFTLILFLGLVYVWAKGDLEWIKQFGAQRLPQSTGLGQAVPRRTAPVSASPAAEKAGEREGDGAEGSAEDTVTEGKAAETPES